MSVVAAQLIGQVSILGADKAKADLLGVGRAADDSSARLRAGLVDGAKIAAIALIGVGVASVKMAGDFQKGLSALVTGAGELPKNLGMVSDGIKAIAIDTGTSTKDLLSAMFMVNSSGKIGAAGLLVLSAAARGAKTDNANLTTVTKALTTIMTDYHLPASMAAVATNELIAAAKAGKMHMEDLAGSMGSILPIAQAAHLSFADVGGAIAVMTNAGMTAQRASANLANAVRSLIAPNGAATKSMKAVSLSAQDLSDTLQHKGLDAALQMIEDHVGKKFPAGSVEAVTAFKHIMGGATGYNVALMLGGKNMAAYQANIASITDALNAGGSSVEGWSNVQQTFNFQLERARAAVEVLMIDIGSKLLPILTPLIAALVDVVTNFTAWVTGGNAVSDTITYLTKNAQIAYPIIAGLGAMVLAVIVPAFATWAIETVAATWPLVAIGLAVAGVVAGLVLLYNTFPQVRAAVASVGKAFQAFGDIVGGVFDAFSRDAQEKTLQAKIATISTTIDQKKALIAQYEDQKTRLVQEMELTHSAVIRAMLQTKIDSINQAELQAQGVVAAATKQRTGVQAQLEMLDPVAHLHALNVKNDTLSIGLSQATATVDQLRHGRAEIEAQLKLTTDVSQRAALRRQIDAIDAAIKQKQGVVKALMEQKVAVETSMTATAALVKKDQTGNILVTMWKGVVTATQAVGTFLKNIFLPIFVNIGAWLKTTFTPVWLQLVDVWQKSMLPSLKQAGEAFKTLLPILQGVATILGGAILIALGFISSLIAGVVQGLAGLLTGLATALGGIVQIVSGVIQTLAALVNVIIDLFTSNSVKMKTDLTALWTGIVNVFLGGWTVIKGIFQGAIGAVVGFVSGFVTTIVNFFKGLYDTLVGHSIIPDMCRAIVSLFQNMLAAIVGFFRGIGQWFHDRFQEAWTAVTGVFHNIGQWFAARWSDITRVFSNVGGWFKQQFQGAVDGIKGVFSGIGAFFAGIWDNVVSGVKGAINFVITGIDNVIRFINGLGIHMPAVSVAGVQVLPPINITFPQMPTIPLLARGGTISEAGYADVGEAGKERIYLPRGAQVVPHSQFGAGGPDRAYMPKGTRVIPQTNVGSSSSAQAQNITLQAPPIYLDGRLLANGLWPHLVDGIRVNTGVHM